MKSSTAVSRDAGRELDREVALAIFGTDAPHVIMPEYDLPYFSTDIECAWKVVETLPADMGLYYHGGIPEYEVTFFGSRGVAYVVTDRAKTAPLAISRAALKAIAK